MGSKFRQEIAKLAFKSNFELYFMAQIKRQGRDKTPLEPNDVGDAHAKQDGKQD
jgi:hypothetical protein